MDTYRGHTLSLEPTSTPTSIKLPFAQRSQRYQKITLKTPNSSLSISSVGFKHVRPPNATVNTFKCSNPKLNKIWEDGVRTIDMCTVEAGETAEAWEVTEAGTRILGQHWAPCRHGTRWGDKIAQFEVKIEEKGASWGINMVANGLIFCLDISKRSLGAFEGLSETNGVFPSIPRGTWTLGPDVLLEDWISVKTTTNGSSVSVQFNDIEVASLDGLDVHPILGGAANNTGSVAFGGPQGYRALYRSLNVTSPDGSILYHNDLKLADKARTFADFQVGTNALSCTIDGAKRDRALFGGDLFVMGRSICYSTGNLNAILGSITLLTSHQTESGYLGNLCPIQAPVHSGNTEPPTYAFYSLSYALLLVVAIKDYWMHSGDSVIIKSIWPKLEKLMSFTQNFVDTRGLVVAPPPLSSKYLLWSMKVWILICTVDWFPMGGPIFGASGKINLAYFDALNSMSTLSKLTGATDTYTAKASNLKDSILAHLWNEDAGIMRMSDITSPTGVCQDINAYAIKTGIAPLHSKAESHLSAPKSSELPLAFRGIERWEQKKVVSPYASGFAAEALFERNCGLSAIELVERVWGVMADESGPDYSGGHWEAMKPDGTPITDDTSLMHGWSTWPVYLLPRYLAGAEPVEAGWSRFKVKPMLAGLESVDVQLSTPAGKIEISLTVQESKNVGEISVQVPQGATADIHAPEGWIIVTSDKISEAVPLTFQTVAGQDEKMMFRICRVSGASALSAVPTEKTIVEISTEEVGSTSTPPTSDCGLIRFLQLSILNRIRGWFYRN
jgi:alpha-L-rhamnosidase